MPLDQFKLGAVGSPPSAPRSLVMKRLRSVEPQIVAIYRKDIRRMMLKNGKPNYNKYADYLDNEDIVGTIDSLAKRVTGLHIDQIDEMDNNGLINLTERAFNKAVRLEGGKLSDWQP